MVISGNHVLRAEIEKWSNGDAVVGLNERCVTLRNVMGNCGVGEDRCGDQEQDQKGEDGLAGHNNSALDT